MLNTNKNRIIAILLLLLLVIVTILILGRILGPTRLKKPESIAYDSIHNTFLISNSGNGKILSLDDKGRYEVFMSKGLKTPRGIKFSAPYLYVTDNTQVHAIDVRSKKITYTIPIENSIMLNDIELDRSGRLFVTDTKANRIFIVTPNSKQVESISSPIMKAPNGIIYDAPREQMLIVCLTTSSPILSLDVRTNQINLFMETLYDNLDGIAIDDLGRIYISSWGEKAIFMIPQEQNRFIQWKREVISPADIYYHQPTNEILVPQMEQNRISRFIVD